jgi:hypothetical protein
VLGSATVIGLGAFIFLMVRRERQGRPTDTGRLA